MGFLKKAADLLTKVDELLGGGSEFELSRQVDYRDVDMAWLDQHIHDRVFSIHSPLFSTIRDTMDQWIVGYDWASIYPGLQEYIRSTIRTSVEEFSNTDGFQGVVRGVVEAMLVEAKEASDMLRAGEEVSRGFDLEKEPPSRLCHRCFNLTWIGRPQRYSCPKGLEPTDKVKCNNFEAPLRLSEKGAKNDNY